MENTAHKSVSVHRWMRILHRDLGFFVIGLTVIYCISGIMLTYRDTSFLKSETQVTRQIETGLQADQLGRVLHLKDFKIVDQDEKQIRFTVGSYDRQTGMATYMSQEIPSLLRAFNSLHVTSSQNGRSIFAVLYAALLLFLAVSSFWMYRPGTRSFKRGLVIAISGVVASIFLVAM